MKPGEKKAFIWIGITLVAIAAITIALEYQHQELHIAESPSDSGSTVSPVTTQNNRRGEAIVIPKGMDPSELPDADSRGATMLTLYCAQCHELPTPAMHTKAEWRDVIKRMKSIMQSRRGGMLIRVISPPEKDWEILETYLADNAQVPLDTNETSDLNTVAGKAFQETCSQCHAAPNPGTHTTNEWPRVVLRMKSHIIRTGKKLPDQDTLLQIIDYLQKHGKASQQPAKPTP